MMCCLLYFECRHEPEGPLGDELICAFQIREVFALNGEAVASGAVTKRILSRESVVVVPSPDLERRCLKRAAKRKAQFPRCIGGRADCVQPLSRRLITLPAG